MLEVPELKVVSFARLSSGLSTLRKKSGRSTTINAEAKGAGFDVKIIREVVRLRREDPKDRDERGSLLDTYLHAIETAAPQHQEAA